VEPLNLVANNSRKYVPEQALWFKNRSQKYRKCPWPNSFCQSPEIPCHPLWPPKMNQGQSLPDLELINAKSLDFAKPKHFFKNIGRYAATLTHIHIWIPFSFTQILDMKNVIKGNYAKLLDKHEEPFKTISKITKFRNLGAEIKNSPPRRSLSPT
jgi:hypothetical protein